MKFILLFIRLALAFNVFSQNKKSLAPTPPMGWNSWNWFGKPEINEQTEDPCSTCEKIKNGWSEENVRNAYEKWSKLLNSCGRDILFSISAYHFRDWYPEYCNMARSTQDIKSRMSKGAIFNSPARENKGLLTVMAISEFNNLSAKSAGNGFWNDPDIKDFKLNFAELGINKKGKTITDVYSGVKISSKKGVISLKMNPHACLFLKVE